MMVAIQSPLSQGNFSCASGGCESFRCCSPFLLHLRGHSREGFEDENRRLRSLAHCPLKTKSLRRGSGSAWKSSKNSAVEQLEQLAVKDRNNR
jgi:hypothetical protein